MAEDVAEKLGPEVQLRIVSTDSEEARSQGIKSAIALFVDGRKVPIKEVLNRTGFEGMVRRRLESRAHGDD
nr:hypothetical protein [Desulfovermiculus halophilus]